MLVLLTILKWIGIVLLCFVALALLVILLVLFFPFTYRLFVEKKEKFLARVSLSFLFRLLYVTLSYYEKEPLLIVRLIGIPVYKTNFDFLIEAIQAAQEDASKQKDVSTGEASAEQPDSDVTISDHTDSSQEVSEETDAELEEEIRSVMEEEEEKLSFSQKIKLFFEKIKLFISNCKKKCYNIYDSFLEYKKKIERISKEIKYYYKVINHPAVKAAWEFLLKKLKKVWRNARPRKIRIWVRYGADDPAQTMKMYGYYCMLAPFTGKAIRFEAVTDEVVFLAEGKVRGRFQVYRFLLTAWSLFFNRNCRKVIKLLRREGKKRGR